MREINIGEKVVRVKASPLALFFYKQAFKTDAVGDLLKMMAPGIDEEKCEAKINLQAILPSIDSVVLLQVIWAMSKADAYGQQFPSFEKWIADLDCFDFSDQTLLRAVMEEAADGFFRGGAKRGK